MNEFSNKIAILPHNQVPTTIAEPYSEWDIIYSIIDIDPEFNQKSYSGNQGYEFKLRATFNDIANEVKQKYLNGRPVVLLLFDKDNNIFQVGTELTPVFVDINDQKLATEFDFIGKLQKSPMNPVIESTAPVVPPYTPPDFDTDKNDKTVTALINQAFSLYMKLSTESVSSPSTFYYRISINDETPEVITINSGVDLSTIEINRTFLNLQANSYLKIECSLVPDFATLTNVFLYKGVFNIINAAISRFNFVSDSGSGFSYFPNEFNLSFNNIPEGDINNLLENFKGTIENRTTDALVFNISGGANAVPTSVDALSAKSTMLSNGQAYSDNS